MSADDKGLDRIILDELGSAGPEGMTSRGLYHRINIADSQAEIAQRLKGLRDRNLVARDPTNRWFLAQQKARPQTGEPTPQDITTNDQQNPRPIQNRVLEAVKDRERIGIAIIQDKLPDLKMKSITNALQGLIQKGLVERNPDRTYSAKTTGTEEPRPQPTPRPEQPEKPKRRPPDLVVLANQSLGTLRAYANYLDDPVLIDLIDAVTASLRAANRRST